MLDPTVFVFEINSNSHINNNDYSFKDHKISLVEEDKPTIRNHFLKVQEKQTIAIAEPINNNGNNLYEDIYNKNEQLTKKCENLEKKNLELEEKLLEKTNELKKLSNDYEQISENFNKTIAKQNALLIYSSELQKKVDLFEIEIAEKNEEITNFKKSDWGRLLQERDKLLKINEKEINYYKQELANIKSSFIGEKRTDSLLENYLQENKKLKRIVEEYKTRENECNKKWNEILNENSICIHKINIIQQQSDSQITNYTKLINEYDNKLAAILIRLTEVTILNLVYQTRRKEGRSCTISSRAD